MLGQADERRRQQEVEARIVSALKDGMRKAGGPDAVRWVKLREIALGVLLKSGFSKHGAWKRSSRLVQQARAELAAEIAVAAPNGPAAIPPLADWPAGDWPWAQAARLANEIAAVGDSLPQPVPAHGLR